MTVDFGQSSLIIPESSSSQQYIMVKFDKALIVAGKP